MNISNVAKTCGLTPKAIRLYESEGLITPARDANGYRHFSQRDVQDLNFLAHARAMGFGLADCEKLMSLYRDPGRASADVKALATNKLAELDDQLVRLNTLKASLESWIAHCPGDSSSNCPIIKHLSEPEIDL